MGDRANIVIRDYDGSEVFLYTHWKGYAVIEDAREALAKGWRWDDATYLARIVFDVMTEHNHGEETGFGISARITDGGRDVVIDTLNQTVTTRRGTVSISEFVANETAIPPRFNLGAIGG